MASSGAMVLAMMGLLAALVCPAAAAAAGFISMPTDNVGDHSYGVHATFCPNLEKIVLDKVAEARRWDIGVVAGLLRIFFHDCFPNGCDASLLLEPSHLYSSERARERPQNQGLHQGALDLIQRIRDAVRDAKCTEVSCADITMLATRQAIKLSGGPDYGVQLGRKDSIDPARIDQVNQFLPAPDAKIWKLIEVFQSRGFDRTDLAALSGAHTIGKTSCPNLASRTGDAAWFVEDIKRNCPGSWDKKQVLDVDTPDDFDHKYYKNIVDGKGVLSTDMELLNDPFIKDLVHKWATDKNFFFWKFGEAMAKMARLPVGGPSEYRENCFKRNSMRETVNLTAEGFAASA
ncbi:cationic peroxidase SPC4-like [Triticum dicoccoides]|uniref:cationic peroxidase SPC4-like n=1 Tax=Triticum dicoccoides TaxID=85692 RepID=UPI00188DCFC0|nr:cationic peroxidase SPC4-like [Triticum dicoccoides]